MRLAQQEILQRALRSVKQFAESGRCKTAGERIDAQNGEPRTFCDRFPSVYSAEMAPVCKSENSLLQFQSDIHMNAVLRPVGPLKEFPGTREPQQLTIQTKVHRKQAAVQEQEYVFSHAADTLNALAYGKMGNMSRSLWFCSNRVQDMNTPDALSTNQRSQRADHSFYFREFRHGNRRDLRSRL